MAPQLQISLQQMCGEQNDKYSKGLIGPEPF